MSEQPRLLPEVGQPIAGGLVLPVSGETEPLVLARGNTFFVANRRGDIAPSGARDLGLFHHDTRHLSYYELRLSGGPVVVLSADAAGATFAQIDLTLTDREFGGFLDDPQNFLHVRRKQILDGGLVEQLIFTNHLRRSVDLSVELSIGVDFADMFEVRGARRMQRGRLLPPELGRDRMLFGYAGLDGELYRTLVRMQPEPARIAATGSRWLLHLSPGESNLVEIVVVPSRGDPVEVGRHPFDVRLQERRREHAAFVRGGTHVHCRNTLFQNTLEHGLEDISALRVEVDGRHILGAGIPWFAAPFGRDSLIASLQLLSMAPALAVETLRTLAAYQGRVEEPWREEEPGKIMHELRRGEMTRAGEIPHSPYYGSVDATPLWLVLLGETHRWLGDRALLEELLPNAERALEWILRRLDAGGGFIRYQRRHARGLENQGWKDSRDGVSHPDGTVAPPPIALVEVQGYAVAALDAMAEILRDLGSGLRGAEIKMRANELRHRLHEQLWLDDIGYYALAIDGRSQKVPTITSNPGHLLFCNACPHEMAMRVLDRLIAPELYTGWGIRTLARGQAVYNPVSYHNGSVWPHDNSLIALGAARVGRPDAAIAIFEGLYAASQHFRRGRLPELFCGLGRGEGDFLVKYPVSCSPQAWASGAFFLLLQACLGLHPDAPRRRLVIANPRLPDFIDELELKGLRVGNSRLWLHFARHGERTHADLADVVGDPIRVQIEID